MTAQFLCAADGQSFTSLEALESHEKGGHVSKGTPTSAPPMNPEFAETLKAIAEAEKAKALKPPVKNIAPDGTELKLPEPKPIKLKYRFEGNCPTCLKEVTTLMVDNEAGFFAIAFCVTDGVQLKSIKVDKIEESSTLKK